MPQSTPSIVPETEQFILSNRSSSFDCFEAQIPNIGSCTYGTLSTLVTIPAYPNCHFHIIAPYYHCADPTGVSIFYLGDVSIHDHLCDQYNADITLAANNGTLEDFTRDIDAQLTQAAGTALILSSSAYQNGQSSFAIEFIEGACEQTCYVEQRREGSELTSLIPVNITCAYDCCAERYAVRIGTNGEAEYHQTGIFSTQQDCNFAAQECPSGTLYRTDCIGGCNYTF